MVKSVRRDGWFREREALSGVGALRDWVPALDDTRGGAWEEFKHSKGMLDRWLACEKKKGGLQTGQGHDYG